MKTVVHQAYFGHRNEAHALLATSSSDRGLFEALTNLTDRPGKPPPDLVWEPFLSGFPFRERYYVLARTFPDPAAPRRGMVFTHALLLELEDAGSLGDLGPILDSLVEAPERTKNLRPIELPEPTSAPGTLESPTGAFFGRAATATRALLGRHSGGRPLVWIGQSDFEAYVALLWRNLWPEARRALRFRLSFDPSDTEGYGLTMVVTPAGLPFRWHDFPVVSSDAAARPETLAEAALLGLREGEPLRRMVAELGSAPPAIYTLRRLEQAYETLQSLETADADAVTTALRILAADAPAPAAGVLLKQRAEDRLAELIPAADSGAVLSLRNLSPGAFADDLSHLAEALGRWIGRQIRDSSRISGADTARVLMHAFSAPETWWGQGIVHAVDAAIRGWEPTVARALWVWWQADPELVRPLATLLPAKMTVERDIVAAIPGTLERPIGERLLEEARRRRWFLLHAATAGVSLPAREAIRVHLAFDDVPERWDGVRVLAERIPSAEFLLGALDTGDERLLKIAGESAATEPSLLATMDVRNPRWREVWLHAIRTGADAWAGIAQPGEVRSTLLDLVLDGTGVEGELLTRMAANTHGDLTDYPRRPEVWNVLPPGAVDAFLRATAAGWLRRFRADPSAMRDPEPSLERAILREPELLPPGAPSNRTELRYGLSAFERFAALDERRFTEWLRTAVWRVPMIETAEASRIGRLIAFRRWSSAASLLLGTSRSDLAPTLHECAHLLKGLDHLRLLLRGIIPRGEEQDWWAVLREFAVENFPDGPTQDHLWQRAGGDASALWGRSGRERWDAAFELLRRGGGGKQLDVRHLLSVMQEERANNDQLQVLIRSLDRIGT